MGVARWMGAITLGAAMVGQGWACGPFLYDNADMDRFSFLDPGILSDQEWVNLMAFASPPLGQPSATEESFSQLVIRRERMADLSQGVSNALYDSAPGDDPILAAANHRWWIEYFRTVRGKSVEDKALDEILSGPDRPAWLGAADRSYFTLLDGDPSDPGLLKVALAGARNTQYPVGLRHRFAFFAVRSLALSDDPTTLSVFREFCPGTASDLPLARAQGWAASMVAKTDLAQARDLWVDLMVRWPETRVQTFSSLKNLPAEGWAGASSVGALIAKYFVDGRDFSPETLRAVALAEKAAGGGNGTESILYSMAEEIEGESGVFALLGLVDPHEVTPSGLYTGLIDQAVALADQGTVRATRTWWVLAAYLCLFDGDTTRATQLLARAQALSPANADVQSQTDLVATLVQMAAERDSDWSRGLQTQVLAALDWGRRLDQPGHNRGLYHSVAVFIAQKELSRGHNAQAALAFGLVQTGGWGNLYHLDSDDHFWTTEYTSNNPVNLLMDALMTDGDLDQWADLLKAGRSSPASLEPLTARLVATPFLTDRDLTWWKAHRALRRGEGARALSLLKTLGPSSAMPSSVFPERLFSYSLDLDPLEPQTGRGMRTVTPQVLAGVMARIEADASSHPSAKSLLAQGEFWLSLQLSGLPLLFAQPPKVIGFVNHNFEYYGYNTGDSVRDTSVVGTFPLGRPAQTDAWGHRLEVFYREEFSTLNRARQAFRGVVNLHSDPEAEFRALLFLQALDGNEFHGLSDHRYDSVALAQTFRTTCELFQRGWL